MSARHAVSFPTSTGNFDGHGNSSVEKDIRMAFSSPIGVFKTLRAWYSAPDQKTACLGIFKARIEIQGLALDNGAFVVTGTTQELYDTMKSQFNTDLEYFRSVQGDYLEINYVRVQKEAFKTVTQTILHIAPHKSWWQANAGIPDAATDWTDSQRLGWTRFGGDRSTHPAFQYLQLHELRESLKEMRDLKPILVKEKFWT